MKMCERILLFFFVLLFSALATRAQEASISLGPSEIGENQAWTITITVENQRLKNYDDFPDIEGFRKRGTSSSSNTQIVNGQISSSQSITMTYVPTKQGTFVLRPFNMKINGKLVSSKGTSIKVGPPVQRRQRRDPFKSLFDRDPFDPFGDREPTEFVDVRDDAFLALTTNKNKVHVGEGFTTTLSFYVAEDNRAPLQFYELGKQLSNVLKKVRPENCWEENFNIENINGEPVTINGKRYTQYKVYQGVFYPLNAEDIVFPSVGLEMIKYKVAKNPSFFGQNRQEDFKTFYSKQKRVRVNELPPHPLKDQVAVGDYLLDERASSEELETGQSFTYEFNIYGEGNVSGISGPDVDGGENFDFYDPNVTENINRRNSRVTGSKSFSYFGIPKEPGRYTLKDYFEWVFFNPKIDEYDTLRSQLVVNVSGESKKNESILSNDLGSFYDRIEFENNSLSGSSTFEWIKTVGNLLILGMIGFSTVFIFAKDIKAGFKSAAKSHKQTPQEEAPGILKSSFAISIYLGLALTGVILFTELVISRYWPSLGSLLYFLMFFFGIPSALFRLSLYMYRREGYVSFSSLLFRAFIIEGSFFLITGSLSGLSDSYQRYAENKMMFEGDLLGLFIILALAYFYIFINSVPYFLFRNGTSIWKAFVPFKNILAIAGIVSHRFPWYKFFVPWPPFGLMKAVAKFQGKSTFLGYAAAVIPFIFFPILFYDNTEKE